MKSNTPNPMVALYHRLQTIGLSKSYVKGRLFPDWWDDEIALNEPGYAEALGYLSRFAALDMSSLWKANNRPFFNALPDCRYKKTKNTRDEELSLARALATRVAQLVVNGVDESERVVSTTASRIRGEILDGGDRWVSLSNLLEYCWCSGIPVLHLADLPQVKKPHGLSAVIDGRPAIVICKREKYSAWLLFILAHEIGHIVLGHVGNNQVILDEDVKELGDDEEKEADLFAIELLTGDKDKRYYGSGPLLNADQLAAAALEVGARDRVDPGHVVLNYAYSVQDLWIIANAALRIIEPEAGATELIRSKFGENFDWSSISRESADFLRRITQLKAKTWSY